MVINPELLSAISENKEVCIICGPEQQLEADEPRYKISISGPERLLKPLADFFFER